MQKDNTQPEGSPGHGKFHEALKTVAKIPMGAYVYAVPKP
jgi:hypothetical protein